MVSQLLSTISLQADVIVAATVIWGVVTFLFVGNKEAKERKTRFMDESILAQRNINLNTLHRLQLIHNKLSKMDGPKNSDEARLFIFFLNDVYYELLEETMKTVTLYPSAQAVRIVGIIEQLHGNWKEWQKNPESILSFNFHALLKKACLEIAGLLLAPRHFVWRLTARIHRSGVRRSSLLRRIARWVLALRRCSPAHWVCRSRGALRKWNWTPHVGVSTSSSPARPIA